MTAGPKILNQPTFAQAAGSKHGSTGIRPTTDGAWAAVKNGRLVGTFHGRRGRLAAIRAAGTDLPA
jgi:hypothetical protein